jgi:hypothetical protein
MISLCIGRMRQGKSTLAYHLALLCPTRVLFDPRNQFHTTSDVIPHGAELYNMLDDRAEIIVRPDLIVEDCFESATSETVEWIRNNPGEKICFLADEARLIKMTTTAYPAFDWMLRSAGEEDVNVIITAHRPIDVPVDTRAIAHFWYMFHTTQEHDLKIIEERCGPEVAEQVKTLRDRELIVWNDSIATWRKHSETKTWFHDLSKPTKENTEEEKERNPFYA